MALVIETGAIVTGANSWVTRADYIAYAAALGVTIPDTAATDIQLVKAAQFIGSHEGRLKGTLVDRDQPLAYPRDDLTLDGFAWEETEIPRQVIGLQLAVALEINAGIDPYNPPVNTNRATRREKIEGAVEVEYFGKDASAVVTRQSQTTALLATLLVRSGLMSIPLVRT